jgi:hypothetical protein
MSVTNAVRFRATRAVFALDAALRGLCRPAMPQPIMTRTSNICHMKICARRSGQPASSMSGLDVRPKQVWVAVTLAIIAGPVGLLYCTNTGTIVMTIVSLILRLLLGWLGFLIVIPICAIWAWKAARESASLFD